MTMKTGSAAVTGKGKKRLNGFLRFVRTVIILALIWNMIRIVESLQAAVEKIPIREAFDELDADRDYHQEKRKQANDMLISRKGLIGKAVGFAPLICLFVGYLIIPLVVIGITTMSSTFSQLT